jgi:hypothetical protein
VLLRKEQRSALPVCCADNGQSATPADDELRFEHQGPPARIGWCGRATARSPAMRASSRIEPPIDWLVEAIPDAAARAKIFGATARDLYFNGK